jgi:DNA-binding NtrC family response regulator
VVERGLLLKTEGDRVEIEDIPLGKTGGSLPPMAPGRPLPEVVRAFEKQIILQALREHGGVVAKAADSLGISRTNLHNKLRKHDLVRAQSWHDDSQV